MPPTRVWNVRAHPDSRTKSNRGDGHNGKPCVMRTSIFGQRTNLRVLSKKRVGYWPHCSLSRTSKTLILSSQLAYNFSRAELSLLSFRVDPTYKGLLGMAIQL